MPQIEVNGVMYDALCVLPYVDLIKGQRNLTIRLTESGRHAVTEWRSDGKADVEIIADLLEHHFGNGWTYIRPSDIGAITEAMIISDDVEYDNDGALVRVGRVFWNPGYAVGGDIDLDKLLRDGEVTWQGVE